MSVNCKKSKVLHFRKASVDKTKHDFKFGCKLLDTVKEYKYLGCLLDETLDFTTTANMLAEAAGRAVGSLVNKCVKEK